VLCCKYLDIKLQRNELADLLNAMDRGAKRRRAAPYDPPILIRYDVEGVTGQDSLEL